MRVSKSSQNFGEKKYNADNKVTRPMGAMSKAYIAVHKLLVGSAHTQAEKLMTEARRALSSRHDPVAASDNAVEHSW